MKTLLYALLLVFASLTAASADPPPYAVAVEPTPVLNTPDFAGMFSGKVRLDPCQGVRPIEFVALPGTLFRIEGEEKRGTTVIYRVTTNDYAYPAEKGYFVDGRFVKPVAEAPSERPRVLPPVETVKRRLLSALGKPYVWGGNVKDGVPGLARYYPAGDPLAGVDCSGLLYEATDGYTPRNTSALIRFGEGVPVAGLTPEQIAKRLKPLDLIVWKGHVMIALDRDTIIESTMGCSGGGGVHTIEARQALRRVVKTREPLDDYAALPAGRQGFVVRRWYSR